MLLAPLGARCGFCGTGGCVIGRGVAGRPTYDGTRVSVGRLTIGAPGASGTGNGSSARAAVGSNEARPSVAETRTRFTWGPTAQGGGCHAHPAQR